MRLAIVSDVHGNLTALEAVVADVESRGVDEVVHGGDLAVGGGRPAGCVDLIRELGWPGIVGNTDELLWRPEEHAVQLAKAPALKPLLDLNFEVYAPATRERLGEERIAWLRELPAEHHDEDFALVHASPGDLWRAPAPESSDEELAATYEAYSEPLAVYCHIHRPYVRELEAKTVANSGSAGSPFDGDARASYLLLTDGRPEVIRVEYDVEREAADVLASGYPDARRIAEMRRRGAFLPVE